MKNIKDLESVFKDENMITGIIKKIQDPMMNIMNMWVNMFY